jgi:hypothetical protein
MALYLAGDKVKINLDNIKYCLKLFSTTSILNGIKLLTKDGYILKDANGLFITAKESE